MSEGMSNHRRINVRFVEDDAAQEAMRMNTGKIPLQKMSPESSQEEKVFHKKKPEAKKPDVADPFLQPETNVSETEILLKYELMLQGIESALKDSSRKAPVKLVFNIKGVERSDSAYLTPKGKVRKINENGRMESPIDSIDDYVKSLGQVKDVTLVSSEKISPVIDVSSAADADKNFSNNEQVIEVESVSPDKSDSLPEEENTAPGASSELPVSGQEIPVAVMVDGKKAKKDEDPEAARRNKEIKKEWEEKITKEFLDKTGDHQFQNEYRIILNAAKHTSRGGNIREKMVEAYDLIERIEKIRTGALREDVPQLNVSKFPGDFSESAKSSLVRLIQLLQEQSAGRRGSEIENTSDESSEAGRLKELAQSSAVFLENSSKERPVRLKVAYRGRAGDAAHICDAYWGENGKISFSVDSGPVASVSNADGFIQALGLAGEIGSIELDRIDAQSDRTGRDQSGEDAYGLIEAEFAHQLKDSELSPIYGEILAYADELKSQKKNESASKVLMELYALMGSVEQMMTTDIGSEMTAVQLQNEFPDLPSDSLKRLFDVVSKPVDAVYADTQPAAEADERASFADTQANAPASVSREVIRENDFMGSVDEKRESKQGIAFEKSLEELRLDLENARREYAEMDHKKTSMRDGIMRFFGKDFAKDNDEEVASYLLRYQSTLAEYKQARLNVINAEDASLEEQKEKLVELLKEIELTERAELYSARVDANTASWMMERMRGMVDSYRDLSTRERLLISGGMFLAGAALGTFGATAAGAFLVARRGFGGAVAGRGTFQFLEAVSQRKRDQIKKDEVEKFQSELDSSGDIEEMQKMLDERLMRSILSVSSDLDKAMTGRSGRAMVGYATGAFIAFGGLNWTAGKLFDGVKDASELVMEKVGGSDAVQDAVSAVKTQVSEISGMVKEEMGNTADNTVKGAETLAGAVQETLSPESIKIEPGSGQSIEGQLIKHFVADGHSNAEAGKLAHRAVLDYLDNHGDVSLSQLNHLSSGEVQLSSDGLGIENIDMKPLREVASSVDIHEKITLPAEESVRENVASEGNARVNDALAEKMRSVRLPELGKRLIALSDMFAPEGYFGETGRYFMTNIGLESTFTRSLTHFDKFAVETVGGRLEAAKNMSVFYSSAMEVFGQDRVYEITGTVKSMKNWEAMAKIIGYAIKEGKEQSLREVLGRNLREI